MKPRTAFSAAFALFALAYVRTLPVPFLSDDTAIVPSCLRIDTPARWFQDPFLGIRVPSGGESRYRPLVAASWSLDHFFFRTDPSGFRLQGFLLHGLAAVALAALAFRIARRLGLRREASAAAFSAGALFALHPAHPNALVWIISRADALSTLLVLLSLLLFVRFREGAGKGALAAALFAALAGAFAKETSFSLPFLVVLADLALRRESRFSVRLRRSLVAGALFLAPFAAYWIARSVVTGGVAPRGVLSHLSGQPLGTILEGLRLETVARLRLLLLPAHRDVHYGVALAALAVGSLAVLVPIGARWRTKPAAVGAGFLAIATILALAPSLYIHLDPERHFNARILHLPLAFVALGLGLATVGGPASLPRAVLLAAVYAAVTFGTNGLWVGAGRTMEGIRAGITSAARAFPDDHLVVLDAPDAASGVPLFLNAGNFVLAPPYGDGRAVEPATTEEALEFARQPLFERWRLEGLVVVRPGASGAWRGGRVSGAPRSDRALRHGPSDPGPWRVLPQESGLTLGDGPRGTLVASTPLSPGFVCLRMRIGQLRGSFGPVRLDVLCAGDERFFLFTPSPITTREGLEVVFALDESADWAFAGGVQELRLSLPPGGSAEVLEILLDTAWPEVEVVAPPDEAVASPSAPLFEFRTTGRGNQLFVTFASAPKPRVHRYLAGWDRTNPVATLWFSPAAWLPVWASLEGSEGIAWYATEAFGDVTVARSRLRWLRPPRGGGRRRALRRR